MDADLPETNQIEYSLETSHLIFDVTPSTGYLYISTNPRLLTPKYSSVFFIRCTDQTHLPNPVFDRAVINLYTRPHSLFACEHVYQFNVTWPQTEPNATARVLCPYSSKGFTLHGLYALYLLFVAFVSWYSCMQLSWRMAVPRPVRLRYYRQHTRDNIPSGRTNCELLSRLHISLPV